MFFQFQKRIVKQFFKRLKTAGLGAFLAAFGPRRAVYPGGGGRAGAGCNDPGGVGH